MWIISLLIAILLLAVYIKIKSMMHKEPPKIHDSHNLSPLDTDSDQAAKIKTAIEDPIVKPASQAVAKKPAKRYLNHDERQLKKIPEIEAKIRTELERRQSMPESLPFLVVCSVLDLDPYSETLKHEFIANIYTRLQLQGQLVGHGPHKIPEWGPVRIMLENVLEASYGMLLYADENLELVRSYMPMLLSKRRSLSTKDQYGDEDIQPWVNFSSRFAVDKLKGIRPLKFFMETLASDSARSTVRRHGLVDMFGLFTRMAITLLEHRAGGENAAPITGIEYEQMLQQQIEEHFPTAHVSTTTATGDHGSDLIVDIDSIRIAIQAKYYQSTVGNAAVQEAFSGKGFYEADFAMVVCNSSYTRHAKELSEKLNVALATTDNFIQIIESIVNTREGQSLER